MSKNVCQTSLADKTRKCTGKVARGKSKFSLLMIRYGSILYLAIKLTDLRAYLFLRNSSIVEENELE